MNNSTDVVDITSKLVSYDTTINPNYNVFPNKEIVEYVHSFAQEYNFNILDLDDCKWGNTDQAIYPSVIYKEGENKSPVILFLGHLDVVPVSPDEQWNTAPFKAEIIEDCLFARGSSDMKSADAAFMAAFANREIKNGTVIIAFSNDEEVGGMASMPIILEKLKENNLLPDFVINGEPSSKPIVVTRRRGALWLRFSFPIDKKETFGKIQRKVFKSFQGDGSDTLHSAQYIFGVDSHAMITAAKKSWGNLITDLNSSSIKNNSVPSIVSMEYVEEGEKSIDKVSYFANISKFMNALASIGSLNWPLAPSKYGISVCPNLFEKNETTASFTFDIRAMFRDKNGAEDTVDMLYNHFRRFIPDIKISIEASINPVNVDPEHYLSQTVKQVAEENGLNILAVGEKLGGASDTRYFTDIDIPGVELGIQGSNEHGPNECSSIASMRQLTKIYSDIFDRLVSDSV